MTESSPSPVAGDDDAIALLHTDQDEHVEIFGRYESLVADGTSADERQEVADELCSLLLVHAALKEEIFYPAVREVIDQEYLIDEALVALDSARSLIDEIQSGDPTEPRYDAQVQMLHEVVALHFEEERAALFPVAQASSLDLEELGAEMSARQELLLSIDDDGVGHAP